ncbi:Glucanosyltransferase-domain-containing protein [Staphylotrichum tortipilum]|uniref:1,3-beta-glucanosyltransferase n=1 Tax=Staphylotrichum tortipilum TaxID=2831512 RepID=A0AAN6MQ20_9PEZI|nr:Glucanosyltransferase-domain-containing protein [Staphylotrichum longicolle]
MPGFLLFWSCLVLLSPSLAAACPPISAKNTKLFDEDGVAYVVGNADSDPLVDAKQCQLDAVLMKKASINTIYVYTVDSTQNHDACMKTFADHGIYVWLQLGSLATNSNGPQWTLAVYAAWTETIDAFANYNNTLAFGIGQETITNTTTPTAPSLKSAARDIHTFLASRSYRPIPLSYSASDASSLLALTASYLTCAGPATPTDAAIDLLGLNLFLPSSCSGQSISNLRAQLEGLGLGIPVVVSEAGCRKSDTEPGAGRDFAEVALLLGGEGREVFSGVSVFEWAMRTGKAEYGVVNIYGAAAGSPVATRVVGTGTATHSAPACPSRDVAKGCGLQIGTVTVRTTVTSPPGAGGTGWGVTGGGAAAGVSGGGLSTGAVAGIAIGAVIGVLAVVVVGVFMCLRRRRRRMPASAPEEPRELPDIGVMEDRPPSYTYPEDKAELPEQPIMVVEMDGFPQSASSSTGSWKMPIQGREDSPTVATAAELPEKRWTRTTRYELEENYLGNVVSKMSSAESEVDRGGRAIWQVSPLSPDSVKHTNNYAYM